jgi:hypothetical protein
MAQNVALLDYGAGNLHSLGKALERGGARVTVTALLPEGLERVVIEPSARIPHTRWSVDGEPLKRDRRQTVELD